MRMCQGECLEHVKTAECFFFMELGRVELQLLHKRESPPNTPRKRERWMNRHFRAVSGFEPMGLLTVSISSTIYIHARTEIPQSDGIEECPTKCCWIGWRLLELERMTIWRSF